MRRASRQKLTSIVFVRFRESDEMVIDEERGMLNSRPVAIQGIINGGIYFLLFNYSGEGMKSRKPAGAHGVVAIRQSTHRASTESR